MASCKLCLPLLLLACCLCAVSAQKCSNYRYQWMYILKDPAAPTTGPNGIDAAVAKWIKEDCSKAVSTGYGPAVSNKASTFGISSPNANVEFADYGGWLDAASLDDLKACYANGKKSGNLAAIRKFGKKATRLVYALPTCMTTAAAPATLRYMFNYDLADSSPATCKKAMALQARITKGLGALRNGDGCDALPNSAAVYGTATNTDYGGFTDFKSLPEMTAYLSATKADPKAARKEIRAMATSVMRLVLPMPSPSAKVAKEGGVIKP